MVLVVCTSKFKGVLEILLLRMSCLLIFVDSGKGVLGVLAAGVPTCLAS